MRILAFSAVYVVLATSVFAQPQASSPATWKVDFVAGPSWPGARSLEMRIAADALTLSATGKKTRASKTLNIPMEQVQSIVYSRSRFPRSESFQNMFPSGPAAGDPRGEIGLGIAVLMVAGITSGMHGQKHCVTLEWEQDGVTQQFIVEVPKATAAKLAEEMERVAGSKWMNLDQRCSKVRSELASRRDQAFAVSFVQPVRISEFHLPAGHYQALVLDRGPDSGELYLFAGEAVEERDLKAIALVQIGPPAAEANTPQVKLDSRTPPMITEMRTSQRTLKVR